MAKPTLHQLSISPTCQRVFAMLAAKDIDHDRVDVDISQKERPDDFNKISPFGKVPVLEHDGHVLLESVSICYFIEEMWPDKPMLSSEPHERAYARQWIQYADRELMDRDAQFVHIERDHDRKVAICRQIFDVLVHLDRELQGNNAYFLGDQLSMVDCVIAPTLNNIPVWSKLINDEKLATYKNVQAYTERLRADPVLAEQIFAVPDEVYEGFFGAVLVNGATFP